MYLVTRYLGVLFVGLLVIQGIAAVNSLLGAKETLERTTSILAMSGPNDHTRLVYDSIEPLSGN